MSIRADQLKQGDIVMLNDYKWEVLNLEPVTPRVLFVNFIGGSWICVRTSYEFEQIEQDGDTDPTVVNRAPGWRDLSGCDV